MEMLPVESSGERDAMLQAKKPFYRANCVRLLWYVLNKISAYVYLTSFSVPQTVENAMLGTHYSPSSASQEIPTMLLRF